MSIKREIIAAIVRIAADHTDMIRKPSAMEAFISDMFGEETYDQKIARNIEEESERVVEAVKRINTRRKFKKITSNL